MVATLKNCVIDMPENSWSDTLYHLETKEVRERGSVASVLAFLSVPCRSRVWLKVVLVPLCKCACACMHVVLPIFRRSKCIIFNYLLVVSLMYVSSFGMLINVRLYYLLRCNFVPFVNEFLQVFSKSLI